MEGKDGWSSGSEPSWSCQGTYRWLYRPRQRCGATEGFLKKQDTDRFEKNPLAEMWKNWREATLAAVRYPILQVRDDGSLD